jgi:TonB family protein
LIPLVAQTPKGLIRKSSEELLGSIVHWQEPEYPAIARAAKAGGTVVVELIVDTDGSVRSARAISGHPFLQGSVVRAAQAWRFNPTLVNNRAVRVIGRVSYDFPEHKPKSNAKPLPQLEKAVRRSPKSSSARRELGRAYLAFGRYEDAARELATATRLAPRDAAGYQLLGMAYTRLFRYREALTAFITADQYLPRSAELLQAIGFSHMSLGDYEEALKAFKRSLETDEPIVSSYFMIGKCYVLLDRPAEAISYYQQGLARYSNDVGHYGLGEAYLEVGRYTEAIVEFKQALELSDGPGKATTHYQLGRAYLKSGDKAAAMKEYELIKQSREDLAEMLIEEIRLHTIQENRTRGD